MDRDTRCSVAGFRVLLQQRSTSEDFEVYIYKRAYCIDLASESTFDFISKISDMINKPAETVEAGLPSDFLWGFATAR